MANALLAYQIEASSVNGKFSRTLAVKMATPA